VALRAVLDALTRVKGGTSVRFSTRWRAECGRAALAASGGDMAALAALLSDGGEFGELWTCVGSPLGGLELKSSVEMS